MQATLIFPHQLFKDHPAIQKGQKIYLIEDELFFTQYKFHKQKILLHRASMQAYQERLQNIGHAVEYLDCKAYPKLEKAFEQLSRDGVKTVSLVDPTDNWLEKRVKRLSAKYEMGIHWQNNPNFLTNKVNLKAFLGKRYFMNPFYIKQRQRLNILVDSQGNPEGGKWNFDHDNRKKLPKKVSLPPIYVPKENKWVKAAKNQITIDFELHYGELDAFNYAVTHEEAENCLDDFLKYRMPLFGDYEDDKANIDILNLDNFEVFEELAIRHTNLSAKKYESIASCVEFFEQNQIDWTTLSDKDVRKTLKAIKGVGNWTMDMILLYSLERPNIFPIQDYHLKKVIHQLYSISKEQSETKQLRAIAEQWSNQASTAVKYLLAWKALSKKIHQL